MLDSNRCRLSSKDGGVLEVVKGDSVVLKRKREGNLYKLEGSVKLGGAYVKHPPTNLQKATSSHPQRSAQNWREEVPKIKPVNMQGDAKVQGKELFTRKRVSFAPNLVSGVFLWTPT